MTEKYAPGEYGSAHYTGGGKDRTPELPGLHAAGDSASGRVSGDVAAAGGQLHLHAGLPGRGGGICGEPVLLQWREYPLDPGYLR